MKRALLAVFAVVSLAGAGLARAQAPAPAGYVPRGYHQHDGFFLQLDLGGGGMGSSALDMKVSGGALQYSVAVGGAVAENFIIGGQLWGLAASSPTVSNSVGSGSADSLNFTGFGVNLTYYFMPVNIYVSATPSIGTLSLSANGLTGSTNSGFAMRLAAGKEWWVSTDWGLGFNIQYAHASNADKGAGAPTWSTNWFGVAFSATYN
ncbi:MAG TPA: hypothetical protein VML50_02960 [Anaeromyxobacter sp.]|nr:hypothetical protein [Anaeromyxobacter sp.]